MRRKIAQQKAVLAIRQIVAGAKELAAIETAMLNEAKREEHNKTKQQRPDKGDNNDC